VRALYATQGSWASHNWPAHGAEAFVGGIAWTMLVLGGGVFS